MISKICLLCLLMVPLIRAYDITPSIPMLDEEKGIRYPLGINTTAKVKVEVFIELLCSDSVAAFPVLKEVANFYGTDRLELVIHQMPLPYHRNAFISTQGLFVIQDQMPGEVFNYIDTILSNSFFLTSASTQDMIDSQVLSLLAQFASLGTGIDEDLFIQEIDKYRFDTVKIWKYGVKRGAAGTPWFFVNGIDLAVNPSTRLTLEDWKKFLDPLFE